MKNILTLLLLLIYFQIAAQKVDYVNQAVPDSVRTAVSSFNLEDFEKKVKELDSRGNFQSALHYCKIWEEKTLKEHGPNSLEHANAAMNFGHSYGQLGEFAAAETLLRSAVETTERLEGINNKYTITAYIYLGEVLTLTGNYIETNQLFQKIVDPARSVFGKNSEELVSILSYIGENYIRMDNHPEALEYLTEAAELAKNKYGATHMNYGRVLNSLSALHKELKNHQEALSNAEEVVQIVEFNVGKEHPLYGTVLNNLAAMCKDVGENDKALVHYKGALAVVKKTFGDKHFKFGTSLINIATLYRSIEELDSALHYGLMGAETLKGALGKEHYRYVNALYHIGDNYLFRYELPQAIDYFEQVISIERNTRGLENENLVQAAERVASAYELSGELDKSVANHRLVYDYAADKVKNRYDRLSEQEQYNFIRLLDEYFDKALSFAKRNPANQAISEICFNYSLMIRGLLLENKKRLLAAIAQSNDPKLKADFQQWKDLDILVGSEFAKPAQKRNPQLDSLRKELNKLESQLARSSEKFKKAIQIPQWQAVQNNLDEGEVVIETVGFLELVIDSLAIDSEDQQYAFIILKKNASAPLVQMTFKASDLGNLKATRRLYAENGILHKKIWQQLAPHLSDVKVINYSPNGVLHRINFGAIPINEQQTIANRFDIRQLGSSRSLVAPDTKSYSSSDAIVFGGIDYGSSNENTASTPATSPANENLTTTSNAPFKGFRDFRGDSWNALEWTTTEANELSDLLQAANVNVQLKMGREATEGSFKALGSPDNGNASPQVIHLATHGYFFPAPKTGAKTGFQSATHPLIRSGLILANANHVWKGGAPTEGKEDGILTAYEIAQMDLSNTELVVLSACETGLGDIEGSEGVYGLQRAFKLAGAKYILMSLWSVKDQKAYEFMTRFYSEMYEKEKSIPEAYQAAQSFMKGKYAQPFNPNAWAGFVLMQ